MAVSRRTVTVLFADVADSTPLGERLDPETLRQVMSRWFERMSEVLVGHGGTVEKFIGDAVMAVFGIPELHEDDALRAVRAATELRAALAKLNEELESELGVHIGIRVGVNTGEVVAGDGTGGQMLVTGDPVNVAKRLEEAARTGEILVGDGTRRLVENAALLEPRDQLTLKGKTGPVIAWNVLGVIEGAPAYARRLDARLVGRTQELRTLRDTFASAVLARACRMVTVIGAAGIGKSRLAAELSREVRGEAQTLTGRCLPYGDGITFWPLVQIVGALGSDEGIRELLAGVEDGELVADRVLSAVGPTRTAAAGGEMFWAVRRLLEEAARNHPLVVMVEDIHWAEPTFLDLLEYLAGWTHDAPVLLLCMSRPDLLEERQGWLNGPNATGIVLSPLTDAESDALLDELAQEWPLDETARRQIKEAAEGNPLYVEQMTAMLAEGGPADAIPPSIHALLAARLDRLPLSERAVLEAAAVAGKEFVRSAVRQLSDGAQREEIDARLLSLARRDLLTPMPGREDAYRFRHALIRDAAYAGIPKELRVQLHERFGNWAIGTNAGRAGELDEIVGYHFEQAYRYREQLGPPDDASRQLARKAGELLGGAGRRAFARDDMPAALTLLDRAVAMITERDPARLELMRELSMALWWAGEVARAELLLNGLIEAAAATGNRKQEWSGLIERAARKNVSGGDSGADELLEVSREAIAVFDELGYDAGLARAWRRIAFAHQMRSQYGPAEAASEQALIHARKAEDAHEEARIVDGLCTSLLWGPATAPEAIERCEEMLAWSRGSRVMEANISISLAGLKGMRGDFEEARALADGARQTYRELGLRLAVAGLTQVSGPLELLAGNLEAAEQQLREGLEIMEPVGSVGYQAALLANVLLRRGAADEAEKLASLAQTEAADDNIAAQVVWRGVKARLDADPLLAQEAVGVADLTDDLNLRADALVNLAESFLLAEAPDEAADALQRAVQLYEQKGNVVGAAQASMIASERVR
jgi:class 3 adenylate cyclase/tetratricopeptide (TPR) repeat protein